MSAPFDTVVRGTRVIAEAVCHDGYVTIGEEMIAAVGQDAVGAWHHRPSVMSSSRPA